MLRRASTQATSRRTREATSEESRSATTARAGTCARSTAGRQSLPGRPCRKAGRRRRCGWEPGLSAAHRLR
eukprot:5796108-Pyramimonas_sp.AAC.1